MKRFREIIQDNTAPGTSDLWINKGKLKYFDGGWKDLGGDIPDLSNYATKDDLNLYLPLEGGEVTGTLGTYVLVLSHSSLGALIQMVGTQNSFNVSTLNGGINQFQFTIQNSTPLKLTEAGVYVTGAIYENNTPLENIYAKLTDIATTGAAGLMSATDKTKLDSIASNANNYTLPNASTSVRGGVLMGVAVTDTDVTEVATAQSVATTLNALLASLRASGAIQS